MHLDRLKDAVYLPIDCKQKMHLEAKSYSLLAIEIALNVSGMRLPFLTVWLPEMQWIKLEMLKDAPE